MLVMVSLGSTHTLQVGKVPLSITFWQVIEKHNHSNRWYIGTLILNSFALFFGCKSTHMEKKSTSTERAEYKCPHFADLLNTSQLCPQDKVTTRSRQRWTAEQAKEEVARGGRVGGDGRAEMALLTTLSMSEPWKVWQVAALGERFQSAIRLLLLRPVSRSSNQRQPRSCLLHPSQPSGGTKGIQLHSPGLFPQIIDPVLSSSWSSDNYYHGRNSLALITFQPLSLETTDGSGSTDAWSIFMRLNNCLNYAALSLGLDRWFRPEYLNHFIIQQSKLTLGTWQPQEQGCFLRERQVLVIRNVTFLKSLYPWLRNSQQLWGVNFPAGWLNTTDN